MSRRYAAVRPLRADDAPAVAALLAEVAREGGWIATEWPFDEQHYARECRSAILEQRRIGWLALSEHEPLGGLIIDDPAAEEPQIGMLVAARARRRGIGRALIDAALRWARARGTAALGLHVFPDNAAARALYAATGFVEVAYERDAVERRDGTRRDAIRMRRTVG